MKLVQNVKGLKPNYIIITGDGRRELHVLKGLSHVFNGHDLILFFPFTPNLRKTGKAALNSIKQIPGKYGINSIIFITDGDTFENAPENEIKNYLEGIGIEINEIIPIQNAYLINCKFGNHLIDLFCIISGPKIFIEEEIAILIKIELGIEIDLSGKKDHNWKKRVKNIINQILKSRKIKLEKLIKETSIEKLKTAFPNFCAVFNRIENEFH